VEHHDLAVNESPGLTFHEDVGLFKWMVVRMGDGGWLMVDHEHRWKLRLQLLVDQHLHADAMVREQGRGHDGRDRGGIDLRTVS